MVGLIIAMEKELAPYLSGGAAVKEETHGGKKFYLFSVGRTDCVAVYSGVGKVNAAYAAALLIERYNPECVISAGVSGGLGRNNIFDLVVSSSCVQYDVDTTAFGDEIGFVSTVNKIYFEADEKLAGIFEKACGAKKCVFASGDRFVADKKTRDFLVEKFDAAACDMESGAIAQAAYIAGVPYAAVRCVSDGAGEGAELSFTETAEKASAVLAEAVTRAVEVFETAR
jgi:adenosylhomocysteine nucleosidase